MNTRQIRGCLAMVLLAIFLAIWTKSIRAVSPNDANPNPLPDSRQLNVDIGEVDRVMKKNHIAEQIRDDKIIGFRVEDVIKKMPDGPFREGRFYQILCYLLASKTIEKNVVHRRNIVCGRSMYVEEPAGKE